MKLNRIEIKININKFRKIYKKRRRFIFLLHDLDYSKFIFSVKKPIYDQAGSSNIKLIQYILKGGTSNILIVSFQCYNLMPKLITNCK